MLAVGRIGQPAGDLSGQRSSDHSSYLVHDATKLGHQLTKPSCYLLITQLDAGGAEGVIVPVERVLIQIYGSHLYGEHLHKVATLIIHAVLPGQ